MIDGEDPVHSGWCDPRQVVLNCIREQAEKVMEKKPVSSILHGLYFSSRFQVPAWFPALSSLCDRLDMEV